MALLLTVSCAARPQMSAPVEPFSETFYAGKDLNFRDLEKLQTINSNAPLEQSAAAGLIMGRHYIRKAQYDKGLKFLERSYRETYLSRYMRFSGMLWLFDAYLKTGKEDKALEFYTMISNRKDEEPFPSVIKTYCSTEGIKAGDDPFADCVDSRLKPAPSGKKAGEPAAESVKPEAGEPDPAPAPVIISEEPKADKVFLVGGSHAEFMQAAIAAVAYKRASFKLEMGDGIGFNSAKVDPFHRTVQVDGNTYRFDISKDDIVAETTGYAVLEKAVTVIAVSNEYAVQAEIAASELKALNIPVHVMNFEKGNFQNEMKSISAKYKQDTRYTVVIFSSEIKLIKVVPLVRYSVKNPEKVKLLIGTDSFGKRYLNDDYVGYFRRAMIFTPAYLAGNANASEFRRIYIDQYGEEPTLSAYMANDMIAFLKGEPVSTFATDVKYMDNGKAVRSVKGFRIVSAEKIEMLGR
ncbi:hypothetical protein EP073_00685 [Geovibrio thiophilus]|uniref:Tetratricopeptide repeat protein n=1 Tax=Geovibrio thiophilus TaxID=139438 RepID=A0A410JVB0_9BACT|nr:hypothetical protein [Geovibrio thiophilus]QAR31968.1 hypothetical protein EP073_00685 [Geovibrio thiophilus]